EVCGSRYRAAPPPFRAGVADNLHHFGLVVGTLLRDWRPLDRLDAPVHIEADGQRIASGAGRLNLGDPLRVLHWLANRRLPHVPQGWRAGDTVATGACAKVSVPCAATSTVCARFDGLGAVSFNLEALPRSS